MKKKYITPETIIVEHTITEQIIAASIRNISGDATDLEIGDDGKTPGTADVKESSNLWDIEW
jgi:hypothetical protein